MTTHKDVLATSATEAANKRVFCTMNHVASLGPSAGAEVLALATPISFDRVNGYHRPWRKIQNAVQTITVNATGGTFTITARGRVTAAIAYNASAAAVQAAMILGGLAGEGDIVVTGGPGATAAFTLTWGGKLSSTAVTVTTQVGSLTGGTGAATVAVTTAGVDDDSHIIVGFLWPKTETLHATEEVLAVLMIGGRINAADVALPSGGDQTALTEALKGSWPYRSLQSIGIFVEGLADIH